MNTYQILFTAVNSLITHFRDDLTKHDKRSIEDNPGVPFLHWTRATGTDLQFMPPADSPSFPPPGDEVPFLFGSADRLRLLAVPGEVARYWNRPNSECLAVHHYDGTKLHKITTAHAVDIASAYYRRVQSEWSRLIPA